MRVLPIALAALFAVGLATAALARPPAPAPAGPIARIVVKKADRRLFLYDARSHLIQSYRIALGAKPTGAKREVGDGATPEGEYFVTHKNPQSKFHLSLGISYPNVADAEQGVARKIISKEEQARIAGALARRELPPQDTKLGGDIFLHGGGTSTDWTAGCIAVDDADIDELFARIPLQTRMTILP